MKIRHFIKIYYPSIIWGLILLIFSMSISLDLDESFTMSIIHHSYLRMISIDTLDVHPPLYYILLKFILNIFTFWTSNLIVKIIIARLFSFLCFIIGFIVLAKTIKFMKLKCNYNILFILLSLVCCKLLMGPAHIRMYPMGSLFLFLEFNNLVHYFYAKRNKYMVSATIFAILAAYSQYIIAIFSGLFLLIGFINSLLTKNSNSHQWLYSGLALCASYLIWIKEVVHQELSTPTNYWITFMASTKSIIKIVIITCIIAYPIIRLYKFINKKEKSIYNYLLEVCGTSILLMIILLFHKPVFIMQYSYPLLSIYLAISLGLIYSLYKEGYFKYCKLLNIKYSSFLILGLTLFCIFAAYSYCHTQYTYHASAVSLFNSFNTKDKDIKVKHLTKSNATNLAQFNTFTQYKNKYLPKQENKDVFNSPNILAGTNKKCIYDVWKTYTYR